MKRTVRNLARAAEDLSPTQLAAIVAIGMVLGAFPMVGCPTVLCALAALALRLNLPALQLVNQLATPVQLALALPFARVGACILRAPNGFGGVIAKAVAGWLCLGVPAGFVLFLALVLVIGRSRRKFAPEAVAA